MVSLLLVASANACSLCGAADRERFTLDMTKGHAPRLVPTEPGVLTGVCLDCWADVVAAVQQAAAGMRPDTK